MIRVACAAGAITFVASAWALLAAKTIELSEYLIHLTTAGGIAVFGASLSAILTELIKSLDDDDDVDSDD